MNSIASDTHAAANRLRRAGFTEDQAQALVEMTCERTALPDISTLATKADIAETKADIDKLAAATKADIAETKAAIAQLEARMESRFGQIEARMESRFGQLDTKIGATQVQSLTILISANILVVGVVTLLSRLIH
jgi:flagellar biosynthesis/type III secretory pathway protein FliH